LVYLHSAIKMMHGPINLRFVDIIGNQTCNLLAFSTVHPWTVPPCTHRDSTEGQKKSHC